MSIIVTYKDDKYDVTKFVDMHPAGRTIIEKRNGKDMTEAFDKVGHSSGAQALLAKYNMDATKRPTKSNGNKDEEFYIAKVLTKKLFTHEDKMNIHKTLGFLVLLSFLYRYCYCFPVHGTLDFQSTTTLNLATLALHMLLSTSSLIFHVLEKRITKNPLVIYEEYRLHAILFTARALGISVLGMYMHLLPMESHVRKLALGGFMVAVHLTVDLVTRVYGTPGTTAVRNRDDGKFNFLKKFFSYYQFTAVAAHVVLDDNLCDLGFNAVIAIQSSAFLMTLKRKGLIRWTTYAFWYGGALILSMLYMLAAKGPVFFVASAVVFWFRITFNLNKYFLWFAYAIACYTMESDVLSGYTGLVQEHSTQLAVLAAVAMACHQAVAPPRKRNGPKAATPAQTKKAQ